MFKWLKDLRERRRKRQEDRALDARIDALLAKARLRPPMTSEEQRAQARSFVRGNLALDGVHVSDEALLRAQHEAEKPRGLPYIVIKQ